jgi:[histone H3]-trimethyl-L-lysine4 demethylase
MALKKVHLARMKNQSFASVGKLRLVLCSNAISATNGTYAQSHSSMCLLICLRYHAKCLKLARGKVKETDPFTCPICDWRVKIPRDAARPKLEELQNWLDELPDLPFQPEEEDLLKRIVDKAQTFREFLQQYTNGNQLCRTIEEMPEMLFYLRKIEGAEVLLSHETNIFRQALHKWQPIAPEPPPILEQSLSTRKPRPTKQQKLMKELGVEKVEDLPPHLRTKQHVRRKMTESFVTGPLLPKPSLQSPSGEGSIRSHIGDRSNTPSGMPRQTSTSNPPMNGQYDGYGGASMTASTPFGNNYSTSRPPSFPASTPSPLFSPTEPQPPEGLRDPMMSARDHDPALSLFQSNPVLALDGEDDLRTGLANQTGGSTTNGIDGESPPQIAEYENMFDEMTNQDPDTQNDPTAMEHEASQASEALDLIRSAGETDNIDGDEGEGEGEGVTAKDFDDFLTTGEDQT